MTTYTDRPWLKQYPASTPVDLDVQHTDMLSLWDAAVRTHAELPFIHYVEETLTFRQVDEDARAFAAALVEGGFMPGERVGIYLQNDPQWPIVMIGTWMAGGIAVALNPMFKAKELRYHLDDAKPTVLVCLESLNRDVVQKVREDTDVGRVITTHPSAYGGPTAMLADEGSGSSPGAEDLGKLLDAHRGKGAPLTRRGDDVAVLTYTSGTTGPPKGAMNTHANMAYNSQLTADWFDLTRQDVTLGVAPLFHITGLVAHMGVCMYSGSPLVLFHRFDPAECLRMVERWGVSFVIAAITVYIALMNHPDIDTRDLSTLTKVASGGAPISPATVERFRERTGVLIYPVYGLTETTSPSHLPPLGSKVPADPSSGALSVGLPVPGALARVVDPATRREVPVGQPGEIVISGPMVVPGYWEKPEESSHALPDGHLHTGDIGFMDEQGWFYIIDRVKDQINASGYKVWPREVEDVLYEHPAVREAAVVGEPDEYRGETVKAFVTLQSGANLVADDLIAFCRERMAAYKYPREVVVLEELPKTPTGKILRRELRDRPQDYAAVARASHGHDADR